MRSFSLMLPWGEGKGCDENVGIFAPKPPCLSQRLLLSSQKPSERDFPTAHGITLSGAEGTCFGTDPGPAAVDRQLLLQAESFGMALMLQPSELLPWGFKALNFYWQQGAV